MRKERILAAMLAAVMSISLTACGREAAETPGDGVENGVAAIEDAMAKGNETGSVPSDSTDDLRIGSSANRKMGCFAGASCQTADLMASALAAAGSRITQTGWNPL